MTEGFAIRVYCGRGKSITQREIFPQQSMIGRVFKYLHKNEMLITDQLSKCQTFLKLENPAFKSCLPYNSALQVQETPAGAKSVQTTAT
jgi:hypothetical protein